MWVSSGGRTPHNPPHVSTLSAEVDPDMEVRTETCSVGTTWHPLDLASLIDSWFVCLFFLLLVVLFCFVCVVCVFFWSGKDIVWQTWIVWIPFCVWVPFVFWVPVYFSFERIFSFSLLYSQRQAPGVRSLSSVPERADLRFMWLALSTILNPIAWQPLDETHTEK